MKVLCLSAYFSPEVVSSSHLTEDLYTAFSENNIFCTCHVPQPTRGVSEKVHKDYIKEESLYNESVTVKRFPMFREGRTPILRAIRYVLCSAIQYYKGTHEKDVDVVYGASTPPTQGMISAMVAKKLSKKYEKKVPFIYNLQDVFPDSLVNANLTKKGSIIWKFGRKIEDYTYSNADKIIVISNAMKKNIMEKGVSEDRIEVVSNWIDLGEVKPIKRSANTLISELQIDPSKFIVVYAGNFGAAQGADIILKVAEQLKKYNDIQFVVFGGGAYFENAKKYVYDRNLNNVIIEGLLPQERVSDVYSLGNVALITCKKGTGKAAMPSKTWSIMACNTPIIASFDTNSELGEVLKQSKAGVIIEPENQDMLIKAIIKQYENLSEELCIRNFVEQNASKEYCVKKYIDIIKGASNL